MGSTLRQPPKVLCVGTEVQELNALTAAMRGAMYDVQVLKSASDGLDLIVGSKFDVVISDSSLTEMTGAEFLHAASVFSPDTVRVLLCDKTASIDGGSSFRGGKINAYFSKAWDDEELREKVERVLISKSQIGLGKDLEARQLRKNRVLEERSAALQNDIHRARGELDELVSTLAAARADKSASFDALVTLLSNIINLRLGLSHHTIVAITACAVPLATKMGLSDSACQDLAYAAKLFQLGKFRFSDDMLNKRLNQYSSAELKLYGDYPARGADVLAVLDGMQGAAKIIRCHGEHYDGGGFPSGLSGESIPLAGLIFSAAIAFQQLSARFGADRDKVRAELQGLSGSRLDPEVVEQLLELEWGEGEQAGRKEALVAPDTLNEFMDVSRDVYDGAGTLILTAGTRVDASHRQRLLDIERSQEQPVEVYVAAESLL